MRALPQPPEAGVADVDWLAHCEGFRVETFGGRLGVVENVLFDRQGTPAALVVLGGVLRRRRWFVARDAILKVIPRRQVIRIDSVPPEESGAAGPELLRRSVRKRSTSPIAIGVADAEEGRDVVECLSRRGLPANLIEQAPDWTVEVVSPREDPARLLADVAEALESWLVDAGRPRLALQVGKRRYTLRPRIGLEPVTREDER